LNKNIISTRFQLIRDSFHHSGRVQTHDLPTQDEHVNHYLTDVYHYLTDVNHYLTDVNHYLTDVNHYLMDLLMVLFNDFFFNSSAWFLYSNVFIAIGLLQAKVALLVATEGEK
jgi:hypothetical protein